tara:strand:+ start:2273 stop:3019 length:747 start_codon:yes stop_codon:yes gene_type:complete
METDITVLMIHYRDLVLAVGPWFLIGLLGSVAVQEIQSALKRVAGQPLTAITGLVAVSMPSLYATVSLDAGFGVLRLGAVVIIAGFVALWGGKESDPRTCVLESFRSEVVKDDLPRSEIRSLWNKLQAGLEYTGPWFLGSCAATAVLIVVMPYEIGLQLFGQNVWLAILGMAVLGRLIPAGTAAEVPVASFLLLKGADPAVAGVLLVSAAPLTVSIWDNSLSAKEARVWGLSLFLSAAAGSIGGRFLL